MTGPVNLVNQSILSDMHKREGATVAQSGQREQVSYVPANGNDSNTSAAVALVDLSVSDGRSTGNTSGRFQRISLQGMYAESWLKNKGFSVPVTINTGEYMEGQGAAFRISNTAFWLFQPSVCKWEQTIPEDIYQQPLAESHACFWLTGGSAASVLAKLCAIDLHADNFPDLSVARTQIENVDIDIIRYDSAGSSGVTFLLQVSVFAAEYIWQALLESMKEFNGNATAIP